MLERRNRGGLQPGRMGLLVGQAGVGTTALLCHLGVDALLSGNPVLHVALGQSLERTAAWYTALVDDLLERVPANERDGLRARVQSGRVITAFPEKKTLGADELEQTLAVHARHGGFSPALVLVDGLELGPRSSVDGLLGLAARHNAALWLTADTHAPRRKERLHGLAEKADLALRLELHGGEIALELTRGAEPGPLGLYLEAETLRLGPDPTIRPYRPRLPAVAYTLLSGGAAGAEAEFGALAQRHGLRELNFTFVGRKSERARGVVVLGDEELAQGDIAHTWLRGELRRTFPDTPLFRKVLQSIWHQVATAGEVFAVGTILGDGTVTGGTGCAVQLARRWDKPVHVYEQERRAWFCWREHRWIPAAEPRVTHTRFCGTGTRFLSDDGRAAIAGLFERSFG
jgi:hypothetical protein